MADYRVTVYTDDTNKTIIITAHSREDAMQTAWSMFDADEICVEEVMYDASGKKL